MITEKLISYIWWWFLASEKLRKYAWDTNIWVFQKEAKAEDTGEGSVLGKLQNLLVGYMNEKKKKKRERAEFSVTG